MYVNELARQAHVPPHVVRYYTQIGLLKPGRAANGYRNYEDSDVYRVRFVRRGSSLGFTLGEMKAIFNDADRGASPCPEVRQIIKTRAHDSRARLEELTGLQARVEETVALWETTPDRPPHPDSLWHLIDAVAETVDAQWEQADE